MSIWDKFSPRVKTKLVMLIALLGCGVLTGLVYAFYKWTIITGVCLVGILADITVMQLVHPKTKFGKVVHAILVIPAEIVMYLFFTTGPIIGILSALIELSAFCMILAFVPLGIAWLIIGKPSPEMFVFFFVCFETILLSNHIDVMKKLMHKIGFWRAWRNNPSQRKLIVIGDYFVQTENTHFVISLLYVIFLFAVAVLNMDRGGALFSPEIDNAIWKAFLVYIAYTTMMTRFQQTEATVDDAADEMLKVFKLQSEDNSNIGEKESESDNQNSKNSNSF